MSLTDGIEGLTEGQIAAINANATKTYEGYESPEQIKGLKDSKDALLAEKHESARLAKVAEDAADAAKLATAEKNGDFESYKKSVDLKMQESDQRYKDLLSQNQTNAIGAEVSRLAAELGGDNAHLLSLHIEKRLRYEDGKVKVTDSEGGLTISTLDDLKTEFRNNPMFASAIIGTKAGGGGANPGSANGGGAAGASNKSWKDMTMKEKTQHLESKGA